MVKIFRGDEFIDRDNEIEFLKNKFKSLPSRILWIYGPKSTGKTTLIEYIVENELLKDKSLNVKYINFRGKMIGSYDTFIDSILEEKNEESETELNRSYNLGMFKLEAKTLKKYKENKINLFDYLINEFKGKKNILIIDEIQVLENIYIDKEKLLLNEFLNLCVRLTKELHLSHIVILTSNTIFLEQIYNNAKLKNTSEFRLIKHLDYKTIEEWLKIKNFKENEIKLIYEYLGGDIARIKKLIDNLQYSKSLEEYLKFEAIMARSEIKLFIEQSKLYEKKEEMKKLNFIMDEIIKNNLFDNNKFDGYLDIISKLCEIEILFYDPVVNITYPNSQIYKKAYELIKEKQ